MNLQNIIFTYNLTDSNGNSLDIKHLSHENKRDLIAGFAWELEFDPSESEPHIESPPVLLPSGTVAPSPNTGSIADPVVPPESEAIAATIKSANEVKE